MGTFIQVLVSGILTGGVLALVSVGVTFVFGVIKVVNFAQGEFVMLGAYFAYVGSRFGVNLFFAILIAIPLAFAAGMVLQRLVIQPLQGHQLMQVFATFGLLLLLQSVVLLITTGQTLAIRDGYSTSVWVLGDLRIAVPRLVVLGVAVIFTVVLMWFLKRTVVGTAIRAISQDRNTGQLMGINVGGLYLVTMGIGITLAVVAGALIAPIYPLTPTIGYAFLLPALVAAVLGGLGSIVGAFIGGMVVGILDSLVGYYLTPSLSQAIVFMLLIVVLVVRPWGLFGSRAQAERAAA